MKSRSYFVTLAIVILMTLAVIALYVYGFLFIQKKIQTTTSMLTQIASATQKNQEVSTIQSTIATTQEDREKLSSYFVTDDSIVTFLSGIEALGTASGTQVVLANVTTEPKSATVTVELTSTGNFSDVMRFLMLFENLPYRMTVDRSTLVTKDSPDDVVVTEQLWSLSLTSTLVSYIPS